MDPILIVDDEPGIRELIRLHMKRAGWETLEAPSGRLAIDTVRDRHVGLLILDLMMDDGDGFEVLRYMRENRPETLIVALSARREIQDKIEVLGLGADDYVTKPFSPMELVARVQAHIRRRYPQASRSPETLRLNKLALDVDNFTLHNDGVRHDLTPVECDLLQFLMRNPDRVLTKREIYRQIWQHDNYDDNNLSVYISRIRKMLESEAGSSNHLQSIRGVGYRFSGDGR
ncbi:response regulator transcription factor [Cohnella sp. GCM10012308]|uniref:response regulator transcription factor n=1 Tax=Cohnella sp. GCM10012308 TaxID=3317329 RepID=UPI00362237BB